MGVVARPNVLVSVCAPRNDQSLKWWPRWSWLVSTSFLIFLNKLIFLFSILTKITYFSQTSRLITLFNHLLADPLLMK